MHFKVFRSSKGDCVLITHPRNSTKNTHILVDGGMATSFKNHVAKYLANNIKSKKENIDLLCVSHIDDDHIVGVLSLIELIVDWRVYHHYKDDPEVRVQKPKLPEPPEIETIWHNSFANSYDLGDLLPRVEQSLHMVEQLTALHTSDALLEEVHEIATSIKKAIILSERIKPEQLNIPLNKQYNGNIIRCYTSAISKNCHSVGKMNLTVIGPFKSDLDELKEDWIKWEEDNETTLNDHFADLNQTALSQPINSIDLANILRSGGTITQNIGDRDKVSIPNLASIMFLLEVDNQSILMTGDGHSDDILKGLKKNKKLSNNDTLHVDILKIQHHGAEANISVDFCKKITADYYIFCGNGTHHNPEVSVLELIYNSRRGGVEEKSQNTEVDNDFEFWFNANPDDDLTENQTEHMKHVEEKVVILRNADRSFSYKFIPKTKHYLEIKL